MPATLKNGTFTQGTKDGEVVYPNKCKCGGNLALRYGGTTERIYYIKFDGTAGKLKTEETDIFWDTPILICEQCDKEYVRS